MRRSVVEVYSNLPEWRHEFTNKGERERFVAWAQVSNRLGPPIGDLADERMEEAHFVGALRNWTESNGKVWIDEAQNEVRVDALLQERLMKVGYAMDDSSRRQSVRDWRWRDRRLRRQRLSDPELAHVANSIAKYLRERKAGTGVAREAIPPVPEECGRDLPGEVLAFLKGARWETHTYNDVAKAVGADWKTVLRVLRELVNSGRGVVGYGNGKGGQLNAFRFVPEAMGWRPHGKEDGRVRRVADLILELVSQNHGMPKRGIRDVVRECLGRCASPTIDAAINALSESGLLIIDHFGNGLPSKHYPASFDSPEEQATVMERLDATCTYAERDLRERRYLSEEPAQES